MARPGYTNLAPSEERDELFEQIAARQGMNAETHKHRVEMIDQALRTYAARLAERRPPMDAKTRQNLYDRYVQCDAKLLREATVEELQQTIHLLRQSEPDSQLYSDREIAEALKAHAISH